MTRLASSSQGEGKKKNKSNLMVNILMLKTLVDLIDSDPSKLSVLSTEFTTAQQWVHYFGLPPWTSELEKKNKSSVCKYGVGDQPEEVHYDNPGEAETNAPCISRASRSRLSRGERDEEGGRGRTGGRGPQGEGMGLRDKCLQ